MNREIQVFFSNRVEKLYQHLKTVLFVKGSNPFARKLVIVPSPPIKNYLMHQMAEDPELQIAFGMQIVYLNQGFEILQKNFTRTERFKKTPTLLELCLLIESELEAILSKESFKPIWKPLFSFFEESSEKKRKLKLSSLSEELARLFFKYGEFGQNFLLNWPEGWQQELWKRLFSAKTPWAFPFELLSQVAITENHFSQIHFFGLSFLSSIKHLFLREVAKKIPVYYWLLSPCQAFWSDIRSDKESRYIHQFFKQKEASEDSLNDLERLLSDRNPLLANFGRLGRHMAEEVETSLAQTDSLYEVSLAAFTHAEYEPYFNEDIALCNLEESLTLLNALQADLVTLRKPESKINLSLTDFSIQLHSAPSKLREVEAMYQLLLHTIATSPTPIEPRDIIVMAPEIIEYAPYIKMVFGGIESQLDCQIMDLKIVSQGLLAQSFLHLLELANARWDGKELLKLFSFDFFQKKHSFKREEVQQIKKWMEIYGIDWGISTAHREEFLKSEGYLNTPLEKTNNGTWEKALNSLLLELAVAPAEELNRAPIDLSSAELIGKLCLLFKTLKKDLMPLSEPRPLLLTEWGNYLEHLLESYLIPSSHDDAFEVEYENLKKIIHNFKKAGEQLSQQRFSATTIMRHFKTALEAKEHSYREKHCQAVRFSSLLPMRAVPAKILALIGLDEESFPRHEIKHSLNLLSSEIKGDYCPSQTDYDRYLFLEALLSARSHFILSYVAKNFGEGKKSTPSPLIQELFNYLDASYQLGEKKPSECLVKEHPFYAFDKCYFEENSSLPCYSKKNFASAEIFYRSKREASHAFLSNFKTPNAFTPSLSLEERSIDLKVLKALIRHPIRYFLNKKLGIYLQDSKKQINSFELTSIDKYQLKKFALKKPLEFVLENAEKNGILPETPFKEIAKHRVFDELTLMQEHLKQFGVEQSQIFDVEFSLAVNHLTQVSDSHYLVPALEFTTKEACWKITGNLSHLSPQGLISFGKLDPSSFCKLLPDYLLFTLMPLDLSMKKIFYVEENKVIDPVMEAKESLQSLLSYFLQSENSISPLMPNWVEAFLEADAEKLKRKIEDSLSSEFYVDHYLKWVFNEKLLPSAKELIDLWQPQAQALFATPIRSLK